MELKLQNQRELDFTQDHVMQNIEAIRLSAWFERPSSATSQGQKSLFRSWLHKELVSLRVSVDEVKRWWKKGWVSFDPSENCEVCQLDDPKLNEAVFVRDVVRSGLEDAQIEWLLSQIESPFTFNPSRIAYSFQFGWVMGTLPDPEVVIEEPDRYDVVQDNLGDWLNVCDMEELIKIRESIDKIIDDRRGDQSPPSEE